MTDILKPSLLKIILAFVLFFFLDWLWRHTFGLGMMDISYYGVPLHYFVAWGPCQAGQGCSEFNGLYLTLDLVLWYIVGAVLVWKFQKK